MTLVADVAVAALPPSMEEQPAEVTASEGLPRDSGGKSLMIGRIININITDHSTYYLFNTPHPPLFFLITIPSYSQTPLSFCYLSLSLQFYSGSRGGRGGGRGRGGGGPPFNKKPESFKDFMMSLPHYVGPEEALERYNEYKSRFWGDSLRSNFEDLKTDLAFRRKFDPVELPKVVEQRNEAAQDAAERFAERGGRAAPVEGAPGPPGFGTVSSWDDQEAGGGGTPDQQQQQQVSAPMGVWDRLEDDVVLAARLALALDDEKGIKIPNPLIPTDDDEQEEEEDKNDVVENEDNKAVVEKEEEKKDEKAAEAEAERKAKAKLAKQIEARIQALQKECSISGKEEEGEGGKGKDEEKCLDRLDALMAYLWEVHGVDFYRGKEHNDPDDVQRPHAKRMLRPGKEGSGEKEGGEMARAMEGDGGDGGGEKEEANGKGDNGDADDADGDGDKATTTADADTAAVAVNQPQPPPSKPMVRQLTYPSTWERRVSKGDPLINSSTVSTALVEQKLTEWVDSQITKIDDQKWGNKLSTKLFMGRDFVVKHIKNKHKEKVEEAREKILGDVFFGNYKAHKEEERRLKMEKEGGGGRGGGGRSGGFRGGRGGGRFGFGGRGGGGRHHAHPGMGMMPAVGGPPMLLDPNTGMMMMAAPMFAPMSGRGGGGRGGGGRGGHPPPMMMAGPPIGTAATAMGGGNYYDLDAPKNNRAVLDYGDL